MNSPRTLAVARWVLAAAALVGIVLVYHRWAHVNPTTVALTLLLLILVLAAKWGLRYAVVVSLAATACYNFYFLPPIGTFTIADPQNWLTLLVFLSISIIASRLAQRARDEASEARARQRELEVLFRLSRELLYTDSFASLLSSIPSAVASIARGGSGVLYLMEGDRLYQAGADLVTELEFPHLRQISSSLRSASRNGDELQIPIRSGVRPLGVFLLRGAVLSGETADAIGGLISVSLDRAQALESIARGEAARESERLRNLMIDSITHELRTPLTSIKGAATTLLASEGSPQQSRELLSIIDEECDRLNRLVSEAVEMAQLDTHQVQLHQEDVRVERLVASSLEDCAWVADQHPIRVQVPADLSVHGDASMLGKVISNLLENAGKYSGDGIPITVRAEADGASVDISVADRGAGIDPMEQPLIFERFYRGRAGQAASPGTGMGLAISRAIIEAHGGTIDLTSRPGEGSVFTVRLPIA
jgi:two-component system sensor histidine kinase KdpD